MGLTDSHVQALSIMLAEHFIGEAFNFGFLEEIFIQMGLIKKQSALDNKSLRIMNRLKEHMIKN